ncbi:hypothetical protein ACAH01_15465 [Halomicrobium sp. HM KBTZ05]|uniref:hypothetical protein n=1 Tax=Halomicrobium sp. HM KBTZ05 TaxID=3242663 RepID=UPI00355877FD
MLSSAGDDTCPSKRQGDDGNDAVDDEFESQYEAMDGDEFFQFLTEETAKSAGIEAEELAEMPIHEFEERSDIEITKPHHPNGAREGYKDTDRLDVVDKSEYQSRRERIKQRLGL